MTKVNGTNIAGFPSDIDITGIIYIKLIIKKYTLAIFENYSMIFLGRKLNILYLDVLISFFVNTLFNS